MIFILFISFISSVRYCIIPDNPNVSFNCQGRSRILDENFNNDLIANQEIVDLYFYTNFNRVINVSPNNRQFLINSVNRNQFNLNIAQLSSSISLSFQNANVLVQGWNSKTLTVNSFSITQSSFRYSDNQRFILITQRFSGPYEGYIEFELIYTNNLRLSSYSILQHPSNPSINPNKINSDTQLIEIEMLDDCYIQFQNYSVVFTNKNDLYVNVNTKARISLYVSGTHYIFTSYYTIYGNNFIPVDIYDVMTLPDRTTLRLNYTGLYGLSIPSDLYMKVGQFSSRITVNYFIQNENIPLTLNLYQNTHLLADSYSSSIRGSIITGSPNANISTNGLNLTFLGADSIERLDGTRGSIQCSPYVYLTLNRFTDHNYISGQRNTISFRDFEQSPQSNFHTNLEKNSLLHTHINYDMSGISYKAIKGSIYTPPGAKKFYISINTDYLNDIYFQRSLCGNYLNLFCSKFDFECYDFNVLLRANSYNRNEWAPFSYSQQCTYDSENLFKCLSIKFNTYNQSRSMKQDIYLGNNVFNNSFNSLLSDEAEYLPNIIDRSARVVKVKFSITTTIDLRSFRVNTTVIISGTNVQNSRLTLLVSNESSNIPLRTLIIENCHVNIIGTSIEAEKIIFNNCQFSNFTVDFNTPFLGCPLSLYTNENIAGKTFSTLVILSINDILINYLPNSISINNVEIPYDKYSIMSIYPLSAYIKAVTYNVTEGVTYVKGFLLSFNNFDDDGYYTIEKPLSSLNIDFKFTGSWDSVSSITSPFSFDLSGVTTVLPQFPPIIGLNVYYDSGSIIFNSNEQIANQNAIFLNSNLYLDMQGSDFYFSSMSMNRGLDFTTPKPVTINHLRVEKFASSSLSSSFTTIERLNMSLGSHLTLPAAIIINSTTFDFSLDQVPSISSSSSLSVSELILNFVNDTNEVPSNFIGIRHNVICAQSFDCQYALTIMNYTTRVIGLFPENLSAAYQVGCTNPDLNGNICLFIYLDEEIDLIYKEPIPEPPKKKKIWVIVVAVLVPLIVIIIAITIAMIILERKTRSYKQRDDDEDEVISKADDRRRHKILAPIPPRRAVRYNPRRRRHIYNDYVVDTPPTSLNGTDDIGDDVVAQEVVIDNVMNEQQDIHSPLSPTHRSAKHKKKHVPGQMNDDN